MCYFTSDFRTKYGNILAMLAKETKNDDLSKSQFEIYIRNYCRINRLTFDSLADKAGIARGTFYNLLKPSSNPKIGLFVSLAYVMNIHPQALLKLKWHEFDLSYLPECQTSVFDANCEKLDSSGFVDETIPDGTIFTAGCRFIKSWTIQNLGQVTWHNRYLRCIDDEHPDYPTEQNRFDHCLKPECKILPIPNVKPMEKITLSVGYTAPQVSGRHISYWKMFNEDHELCFPDGIGLYVSIMVNAIGVNYAQSR